jgi:hypothetical protein
MSFVHQLGSFLTTEYNFLCDASLIYLPKKIRSPTSYRGSSSPVCTVVSNGHLGYVGRLSRGYLCHANGLVDRVACGKYLCGSFNERTTLAEVVGSCPRRRIPWFSSRVLFIVFIQFLEPIQADEWTRTIFLMLILLVVGILAGAGLSLFTAYLNERRRQAV